jgi:hypothetical protein
VTQPLFKQITACESWKSPIVACFFVFPVLINNGFCTAIGLTPPQTPVSALMNQLRVEANGLMEGATHNSAQAPLTVTKILTVSNTH